MYILHEYMVTYCDNKGRLLYLAMYIIYFTTKAYSKLYSYVRTARITYQYILPSRKVSCAW